MLSGKGCVKASQAVDKTRTRPDLTCGGVGGKEKFTAPEGKAYGVRLHVAFLINTTNRGQSGSAGTTTGGVAAPNIFMMRLKFPTAIVSAVLYFCCNFSFYGLGRYPNSRCGRSLSS
ncbi:hypothetical protein VFPPC_17653 [Pochonia chlamydosporia 170]|uniref:Uncharacterized protein n=1 Tax=Pochonia chlamydosporia 170 TaxID=1380566 RepID=A0A219AQY6_METCM|nr:hypothetical protein VFPPC_17653 [Pochonia chlamydosporia 170]OWT43171.1 hypothetical protein VFPPC_17653 [Pochonia chlamydosporia 170]